MVSYYYNPSVSRRKVQCPECGHEMRSQHKIVQCTVDGCRHRFVGDDHLFKTPDDILKEHGEIYEALEEVESRLTKEIENIQKLKQKLKPLTKPKRKENKTKPI